MLLDLHGAGDGTPLRAALGRKPNRWLSEIVFTISPRVRVLT